MDISDTDIKLSKPFEQFLQQIFKKPVQLMERQMNWMQWIQSCGPSSIPSRRFCFLGLWCWLQASLNRCPSSLGRCEWELRWPPGVWYEPSQQGTVWREKGILFHEAIELPSDEKESFYTQNCQFSVLHNVKLYRNPEINIKVRCN